MTAIIVDDEKHCREVLEIMLQKYCSDVKLLASAATGVEALALLERESPDLVFLDIEMPGMNAFELLEKLEHPSFEIIFTTAYDEYALKAIKHSALDYLLKPVVKEELIATLKKAREQKERKSTSRIEALLQLLATEKRGKRFAVPTHEGLIMIDADDILYCESDSAYCRIFLMNTDRPVLISKTLKEVEEVLRDQQFCRVHNSYLVNIKFVKSYIRGEGGEVVMDNNIHLPVSRARKQELLSWLQKI
ncbi:MAG: response regulator transcription factor [Chitinophagaceae bacterium]|nr:response regulator transcription factor [Chitinophagaceae bacterium]